MRIKSNRKVSQTKRLSLGVLDMDVLTVFEHLIFISMDLDDLYFSAFSLVYISIEKIYQTLMTLVLLHFQTPQTFSKILC